MNRLQWVDADIRVIQGLLGHASLQSTARKARVATKRSA